MGSPYDVLQVDPDAEDQEIDRAYRRRVKETHPDQGGSAAEFQRVRAAYEELMLADGSDVEEMEETLQERAESTVEYLNYEVLDDHGWHLDDEDLFEKAAAADLDDADYGEFRVGADEYLLDAAESCGYAWPFACRGGACANCAIALTQGELEQPVDHILSPELLDRGFRLSCMGAPISDELQVVYNVKHLPELDELRLPPHPFNRAHASD